MPATKTALTIEAAKAIAAACEKAAKVQNLKLVIAIVDDGGHLVLLRRDDGAQVGSVEIATLKARTAVLFKRPTKAFQDVVEGQGRYALLCIPNGIPLDGGRALEIRGRDHRRDRRQRRKRRGGRRHRPHRGCGVGRLN